MLIVFLKTSNNSFFVFSSSLDSVEPPVKSGLDGCEGWSGVLGSGRGEGVELLAFGRLDGITVADASAGRFKPIIVVPEDSGRELAWFARLASLARSFIS